MFVHKWALWNIQLVTSYGNIFYGMAFVVVSIVIKEALDKCKWDINPCKHNLQSKSRK
jgi:hypothetical protein